MNGTIKNSIRGQHALTMDPRIGVKCYLALSNNIKICSNGCVKLTVISKDVAHFHVILGL